VYCDGERVGPLATGPGGGCTIANDFTDKWNGYYIFTCGTEEFELAKAICNVDGANVAYDPKLFACDLANGGSITNEKCGTAAIADPTVQFCQDASKNAVRFLCGSPGKPLAERIYTENEFCQPAPQAGSYNNNPTPPASQATVVALDTLPDSPQQYSSPLSVSDISTIAAAAAGGTIQPRCAGRPYAAYQFCYNNTDVTFKCVPTSTEGVSNLTKALAAANGNTFTIGQTCQVGVVMGICGADLFDATNAFCQSAGNVKNLCGAAKTAAGADVPLSQRTYTANQFCQNQDAVSFSSADVSDNDPNSKASTGKIVDYCNRTASTNPVVAADKLPYSKYEFCQGPNTSQAAVEFLCDYASPKTLADGKTYPSTSFCQTSFDDEQGAGAASSASYAEKGKILTKCRASLGATSTTPFSNLKYCSLAGVAEDKGSCGGAAGTPATNSQACDWTPETLGDDGSCAVKAIAASADPAKTAECSGVTDATDAVGGVACAAITYVSAPAGPGSVEYFDPESEFCILDDNPSATAGKVYSTCKAPVAPTGGISTDNQFSNGVASSVLIAAGLYNPAEKVCELTGNVLYDYGRINVTGATGGSDVTSKYWLRKNVVIGGASTFTWDEANVACASFDKGDGPWALPLDADVGFAIGDPGEVTSGGAQSADNTLTRAAGGIGYAVNLKATSGWAQNPSAASATNFDAVPATVTGIANLPSTSYAYWWTKGERGWTTTQDGDWRYGSNYDLGNYFTIRDGSSVIDRGGSNKTTTKLSVRCVRN